MSLTQYYTATTLDGFIADEKHSLGWLFTRDQDGNGPLNYADFIGGVGALAMGSTTYEWIVEHEFAGKDASEWKWPYDVPCCVFTHRRLTVVPGAPIAVAAQQQIATFLASGGTVTIDPDGPGPLFETPIAGPLPEELNFIP